MFIGISFDITRKGSGASSTLLNGLVSYWKLDEASGIRVDSLGTNPLTDNNTVASSVGKIGNGATFVAANSESLTKPDTDNSLDGGNRDFTYSVWFKTTTTGNQTIIDKSNYADHGLNINTGALRWEMGSFIRYADSGLVNDGNWHHVICWYDSVAAFPRMVVDNGSILSSPSVMTSGWYTDNQAFALGATVGSGFYFDGSIDEVGRWNRLLTVGERTQLWNGGAGLSYPF